MKDKTDSKLESKGAPVLRVRAAGEPENERFDTQMGRHHYLGAGRPVGDYLRQNVPNQRPKRLWLRELVPGARQQLRAVEVPEASRGGLTLSPSGVLPVSTPQMDSLLDVFRQARDPRDTNTVYRIGPVLTLIAMALLAGRRAIAEIARFATRLSPAQRRRLALPRKAGTRGFYKRVLRKYL